MCHYFDNPYHNFRHAFCVAHAAWRFLNTSTELCRMLSSLDRLARPSRV